MEGVKMISIDQILQAKEDLPKLAGETLGDLHRPISGCSSVICANCGMALQGHAFKEHCPIPLEWPEAMKLRKWAIKTHRQHILNAAHIILSHKHNCAREYTVDEAKGWMAFTADETDWIKFACICKLLSEGKNNVDDKRL